MNKHSRKYKSEDTGSISELMLLYLENQKTGYIHSVFNSSLNVEFGKNIVHISDESRGTTSFGCCISREKIKKLISICKVDDIVIKKIRNFCFIQFMVFRL